MVACSQNGLMGAAAQEASPTNSLSPTKVQKPALPLNATLNEMPGTLAVNKPFGNTGMEELLHGLYQDAHANSQAARGGSPVSLPVSLPVPVVVTAGQPALQLQQQQLSSNNLPQVASTERLDQAAAAAMATPMSMGDLLSKILPGQVQKQVAAQLAAAAAAASSQAQLHDQRPKGRDIRAIQRKAKEKKANRANMVAAGGAKVEQEDPITEEYPQDSYIAKKRKRMAKNRESAARSRQRKQEQLDKLEKDISVLLQENQELRNRIHELEANQKAQAEAQAPPATE